MAQRSRRIASILEPKRLVYHKDRLRQTLATPEVLNMVALILYLMVYSQDLPRLVTKSRVGVTRLHNTSNVITTKSLHGRHGQPVDFMLGSQKAANGLLFET